MRAPQTEHLGAIGQVRSAADAPILYWFEESGIDGVAYVDGTIAAYAYPSDDSRVDVDTLVLLGKNRIHTRGISSDAFERRIAKNWCTHSLCVTPDGDAAIGISPTFCRLLRFQWARVGSDGESRPAREIDDQRRRSRQSPPDTAPDPDPADDGIGHHELPCAGKARMQEKRVRHHVDPRRRAPQSHIGDQEGQRQAKRENAEPGQRPLALSGDQQSGERQAVERRDYENR